jgi:predicted amidophosphoribosyltransferase
LIDNAVGSGATLNMIAEKLKAKKVGKKLMV